MIVGIGVDTVAIDRFSRQLSRTPKLAQRLFTHEEQTLPLRSLAARFAAKEALIKALGGSGELRWHDLEVVRTPSGRPEFRETEGLRHELRVHGAQRVHLSMTHDGGIATAFVIAEADEGQPRYAHPAETGFATPQSQNARPGVERTLGIAGAPGVPGVPGAPLRQTGAL